MLLCRNTDVLAIECEFVRTMTVAISGAQVFSQPIFETVERWIEMGKYSLADRPILMRAIVRCSYVAFTCFMSILIPFFGDLMGCASSCSSCPGQSLCLSWLPLCDDV
jgi:hypothetical protein